MGGRGIGNTQRCNERRNIDTGGARALVESTVAAGEGEDERGEGEREYEYCIEANVVVYTSRGVNTRAKTFSRGAFSLRVTHGDPRAHTHTHTHALGQAALKMVTEEGNLRNIFRVGEKSGEK